MLLFSVNINEENLYLLPLLPAVAVTAVWCAARIQWPLATTALIAALTIQWLWVYGQAFGFLPPSPKLSHWVRPFDPSTEKISELEELVRLTCPPEANGQVNAVGVELPWLNANSLSFYGAKARLDGNPRCFYTSLGYAETDVDRAWKRLVQLKPPYFISLRQAGLTQPPNFVNRVSLPVTERVMADRRFVQLPFDSKLNIIVFWNLSAP